MAKQTKHISKKTINKKIQWILEPLKKNIKWKGLVKRWFLFMIAGIIVMWIIQSFARYDFSEADTLTSETGVGCDKIAMMLLLLLPPIEELLFRIMPYHYMGKRAAFIGSIVWALLHLFGRNFAVVGFQIVMGVFYFKLVTSGRYKESILFHEAFNFIPLLTCLLF